VVRHVRPTLLQFHGDEEDAFCRGFGVPYIKAVAMGEGAGHRDARELQTRYPGAAAFLFDAHADGGQGGTGTAFDWSKLPTGLGKPFVLAGGLTPDNVQDAIRHQGRRPDAPFRRGGAPRGLRGDGRKRRRFVLPGLRPLR
jgi:phosphoribosylanthranilate isomerase